LSGIDGNWCSCFQKTAQLLEKLPFTDLVQWMKEKARAGKSLSRFVLVGWMLFNLNDFRH
jgi:hypothetical protein